ncbi:MAG: hypothetical protein HZA81_00965 [Candidatus Taylorbacteria bacterium]|nr:hypothetical protein [Candidatus Taylorbacteria bacterium]
MTKKPIYNALLAAGYISLIVLGGNLVALIDIPTEDNLFAPMGMLALLVLSAATMAYLFFYQPVMLLIEGKKEEAAKLLLKTISAFAVITAIFLALALFVFPFV